jgi:hypothetical protein
LGLYLRRRFLRRGQYIPWLLKDGVHVKAANRRGLAFLDCSQNSFACILDVMVSNIRGSGGITRADWGTRSYFITVRGAMIFAECGYEIVVDGFGSAGLPGEIEHK